MAWLQDISHPQKLVMNLLMRWKPVRAEEVISAMPMKKEAVSSSAGTEVSRTYFASHLALLCSSSVWWVSLSWCYYGSGPCCEGGSAGCERVLLPPVGSLLLPATE